MICRGQDINKVNLQKYISYICNNQYSYFLNKKNVIGVGVGYKKVRNFHTANLSIHVFVNKKIPVNQLDRNNIIPLTFKGIKTDVIENGMLSTCSLTNKIRPVKGGYAIGPNKTTSSGTLGCLVTDGQNKFLLSNNHVIAKLNELILGHEIIQPSDKYGGKAPNDVVATLHRYVPLSFIEKKSQPINFCDCAIGLLTKSNIVSSEIALAGKLKGVKEPTLNQSVEKVGSKTELTRGIIQSVDVIIEFTYSNGKKCLYKDQIITTKMSEKGDSGAILFDKNKYGIGLLFGESDNTSIFNRLDRALDELDVELVI